MHAVYVLYVYDHCPFCNRVEYLLANAGIPYKRVLFGYGAPVGILAVAAGIALEGEGALSL